MNTIRLSITLLAVVAIFAAAPASADACTTEVSCEPENSYGSELTGVNDIEYWDDTDCLMRWDCEYADGTQTRHFADSPDDGPKMT